MWRSSLLAGLALQIAPRAWLLQRLGQAWPGRPAGACFAAYFSGRVALQALARHPAFVRRVALVPEYLCNVVPLAFEQAGWRVCGYPVDAAFVPDAAALRAQAHAEGADLLLLAPLYGSDGGLSHWLAPEADRWRADAGVALVLDLCQDAGRLAQLVKEPGSHWAAVLSFNDKSFPGVMGACVWSDLDLGSPPPPRWRQRGLLAAWALRKCLPRRHPAGPEAGFEHSEARRFPYAFSTTGASALQLALGLIGLGRLPRWQARRRALVVQGAVRPLPLPYAETAPFVVAAEGDPAQHRRKAPYALAHDAAASLLPQLLVRHNKGYDDR